MNLLAHTRRIPIRPKHIVSIFVLVLLIIPLTTAAFSEALTVIGDTIGNIILTLCAKVTWIGGKALDISMRTFVLDMGQMLTLPQPMASAVNTSWTVIRDICNLAFIFGFIYIGIRTIIDPDRAQTKKFLSSLIIAALLINFSLFFTKVVIDVANIFAVETYELLSTTPTGAPITFETVQSDGSGGVTGTGESQIADVGARFADVMGILSLYQWEGAGNFLAELGNEGDFSYYVVAGLFLIIAGIVFLAGAVLILFRFVTLVFIMIFSPLLFAATIFPKTASYADQMWSRLLSSAFFAPVYLLLILISLRIMEQSFRQNALLSEAISNNGSFDVVVNFIVVIIFMVFALQSAQKMSVSGAGFVTQQAKLGIGAVSAGGLAFTGRNALGRMGAFYASKNIATDTRIGRGLNKLGHLASTASYDARSIAGAGKALGIGDGKASKGGIAARRKARDKAFKAEAERLGPDTKAADNVVKLYKDKIANTTKQFKKEDATDKQKLKAAKREQLKQTRATQQKIAARRNKLEDPSLKQVNRTRLLNEITALEAELNNLTNTFELEIDTINDTIEQRKNAHEEKVQRLTKTGDDKADFVRTQRQRAYLERQWLRRAAKKKVMDEVVTTFNTKAKNRVGGKKKYDVADDILEVVNEIKNKNTSDDKT